MDTPKTKPDMLAASYQAGGGKRILAALEHGGKPASQPARATAWTIDRWTASLGMLLLLMLGAAWMMHGETNAPSTARHSDRVASERPGSAGQRLEAPPPPAPAAEQAAAIVNESPAAGAPPALAATNVTLPEQATGMARPGAAAQSPPTGGAQAPDKRTPTGLETAPRVPPSATARNATNASARAGANTVAVADPSVRAGLGAGTGTGARASAGARPSAAAGSGAGSRAANAATATRDTDVTLLTALVAHANNPTVTVAERSRDVVERQAGDTTAQLLARCQQLGLIEGMLCRSRICSGRWDADAACRAPAH